MYQHGNMYYCNTNALINALEETLRDEEGAIGSYYQIAQKAPNEDYRRVILGIRKDEMGHALKTRRFLSYLTGKVYSGDVNYMEGDVKDFRSGVRASIVDEEGAAVSYKNLMDMAMMCYPEIYYGIAETRKDEQTHALLLKSLLE